MSCVGLLDRLRVDDPDDPVRRQRNTDCRLVTSNDDQRGQSFGRRQRVGIADSVDEAEVLPPAMDGALSPSHELGLLRLELMQFERLGNDLIRYKLFAAAVLGGVAAGVGPAVSNAVTWVVVLIPLACIFVDAAHIQTEAAILTIARFMREHPRHVLGAYEHYVRQLRREQHNPIKLHHLVLVITTVALSLAVTVTGVLMLVTPDYGTLQGIAAISSGLFGAAFGSYLHRARLRHLGEIDSD